MSLIDEVSLIEEASASLEEVFWTIEKVVSPIEEVLLIEEVYLIEEVSRST